jgi:manganese/iron transport system permease protein
MTALMIVHILSGALVSGASLAVAGFILSNLRLSFLSVTMSHAAMAGAVYAHLLGLPGFPCAFAAALVAALAIGPLSDLANIDTNLAMGVVFSFAMGLAFLGIGLAGPSRADLLGLIWGSVLLLTGADLALCAAAALMLFILIALLEKEIKAVLFSRALAAAAGLRERAITYTLIALCGAVITASLQTVGGLMIFALLTNPVAAASRLFDSFRWAMIGSGLLGAASALLGIALSAAFNLPAGASIVLASGLVLLICLVIASRRVRHVPAADRSES